VGPKPQVCPTIQLHVVQELWDLFQSDDDSSLSPGSSNGSSEQLFLAISKAALSGSTAPRTVKFNGSIQHKQVTMLLDSGSSCFIYQHLLGYSVI
jgi:hypothetical protein